MSEGHRITTTRGGYKTMPTEEVNISVASPDGVIFSMNAQRPVDQKGTAGDWEFYILGAGEANWLADGRYEVDGIVFTSDDPENPPFQRRSAGG